MSELVVFTSVFGHTDPLHEPEVVGNARYICFTDQPVQSKVWEIVRRPATATPTRDARLLKALAHRSLPGVSASLWIDAAFTLQCDPAKLLDESDALITGFRHRDRQRIKDEAVQIVKLGKAKPDAVFAQLATYQADGFDTDANPQQVITCGGFILRRHTPEVETFNEAWAREIATKTLRDQMSTDYVAWKLGMRIGYFNGFHNDNRFARFNAYKRPTNDF